MEWERTYANHKFDKGLISKVYKEDMQVNSKTQISNLKKWTKELNRHLSMRT